MLDNQIMKFGSFFWTVKDLGKGILVESDLFGYMARFVGENVLSIFLKKGDPGYVREVNGTDIKMSRSIHFSEFLTEDPLNGYINETSLDEKERVIDAGAYPGEFAIYAAKQGTEVLALEPDPQNAEELRENIELNGLSDKVKVIEKGLWDQKTKKKLERDTKFGLGSHIEDEGQLTIELDTLDNLISDHGPVDFVKMDVEGAEARALQGAEKMIEDCNPEFAVATYHTDENGEKTCHRIEEILEQKGYEVKTGYRRHLTTYAKKDSVSD